MEIVGCVTQRLIAFSLRCAIAVLAGCACQVNTARAMRMLAEVDARAGAPVR